MTKVISLTILHYGLDYLEWALRSIRDEVDECYVLYTPAGSFGFQSDTHCPEREPELHDAAKRGAGYKLRWHKGHYYSEGLHRDMINRLCRDYTYMMVVDADEIWQAGLASDVIHHFERHPEQKSVRIATPQFWRSFWRGMPNDGLYAEHGWKAGQGVPGAYLESDKKLFHFGYAQNEAVTYYKQYTHGHRREWRWGWYDEKFIPNAQIDIHPVMVNFWNAEALDPFAMGLPGWMHEHPYSKMEIIR